MTRQTDTIRRRPDGSIDTAHYIARGRAQRSRQAHRLAAGGSRRVRGPGLALVAVLAALFALPGGDV